MLQNPEAYAPVVLVGVRNVLSKLAAHANERWRLDLWLMFAASEGAGANGVNIEPGTIEARDYHDLLTTLTEFAAYWRVWLVANTDPSATAKSLCETYVHELEGKPSRTVFVVHVLREEAERNGKPELVSKTLLAEMLTGCIAAQTKLSGERRDRKELRERLSREGDAPKERLLQELPAEVLDALHSLGYVDHSLNNLKNEVMHRIRREGSKESVSDSRWVPVPEENEPGGLSEERSDLEAFEASEYLQQLIDDAGVTQQQFESFYALRYLELTSKEAAVKYGRSAEQIRQEDLQARRKLRRQAAS